MNIFYLLNNILLLHLGDFKIILQLLYLIGAVSNRFQFMNIILLLYEVNFKLKVIMEIYYFFNTILVLCQLILNLFYTINIMLQLYQGNHRLIFVP